MKRLATYLNEAYKLNKSSNITVHASDVDMEWYTKEEKQNIIANVLRVIENRRSNMAFIDLVKKFVEIKNGGVDNKSILYCDFISVLDELSLAPKTDEAKQEIYDLIMCIIVDYMDDELLPHKS